MKKVITTGQLTLRKLNAGCGKLMRAIAPTYGAGGKTVLNAGYTGAPELLGKGASAARCHQPCRRDRKRRGYPAARCR